MGRDILGGTESQGDKKMSTVVSLSPKDEWGLSGRSRKFQRGAAGGRSDAESFRFSRPGGKKVRSLLALGAMAREYDT